MLLGSQSYVFLSTIFAFSPRETTGLSLNPLKASRRAFLGSLMVPAAGSAAGSPFDEPSAQRQGLQSRWLESIRIVLQDEADATQYGGELAPGGPPPAIPSLLLIPIVRMQATLKGCNELVREPSRWTEMLQILSETPFDVLSFKKVFNAYADNIYYVANTEEANAYLLGGSTPSTRQTTQYLLRNEALKWIAELADELRYQLKQPVPDQDSEVAVEYLGKLLAVFEEYLSLVPKDELELATAAVYKRGSK